MTSWTIKVVSSDRSTAEQRARVDQSVEKLDYGQDDQGSISGRGNDLCYHIQIGSRAHPASYPVVNRGPYLGSKTARE
jgi:hypothetical protein